MTSLLSRKFHEDRAEALIRHNQTAQSMLIFSARQMGFFVLGREGQWCETPRTWGTCGSEVEGSFDSWLTIYLESRNQW